jgi:hypothetical protein
MKYHEKYGPYTLAEVLAMVILRAGAFEGNSYQEAKKAALTVIRDNKEGKATI